MSDKKKPSFIELIKKTYQAWSEDNVTRLAAALSYYTIFSLAPLLLILISFVSLIVRQDTVRDEILIQLQNSIGHQGATFIMSLIKPNSSNKNEIFGTIVGFCSLLLGALGIFGQLKASLNDIWHVKSTKKGIKGIFVTNFLSFVMVLLLGSILIFSLIVSTVISALSAYFEPYLVINPALLQLLNFIISFIVITIVFAIMYRLLPEVKIKWSDVWTGAVFTSLLFVAGKFLIAFYLTHSAVASQYGAAGSLIIILLWIYYSSQILFFGAEFTKVYTYSCGTLCKAETARKEVVSKKLVIAGSFIEGFVKGLGKSKK